MAVSPNQNPGATSEAIAAEERTDNVSAELIVAGTNIFDELDVLHEAATVSSCQNDTATSSDPSGDLSSAAESRNETAAEAVAKEAGQIKMEGEPQAATPAPIAESELQATVQGTANETPAAIPDEPTRVEDL
ncbi:MAG TPA: hypothetical protein VJS43_03985, partial [Candidatus Acidoferrales bacterium]|nr:hypothetical protein [Candidatus Acidoferrales bacterium]